jgi:two-component system LytT family response regulator
MMRALIVDDEKPARQRLLRLLEVFDDISVVGEAGNGVEALEQVQRLAPDVAFLDIEMPELNGLEAAQALGPDGPAIVFVTAYDEYAVKAFDAAAVDYLVKPVSPSRLAKAIERVKRQRGQRAPDLKALLAHLDNRPPTRFAVRVGGKFDVLDVRAVSAVLATDHYATIVCGEDEFLSEDSLDALAQRLDPHEFVRVHRSAIVNLAFLSRLERKGDRKYLAVLSDAKKTRVAVSRDRLPQLKQRLGLA